MYHAAKNKAMKEPNCIFVEGRTDFYFSANTVHDRMSDSGGSHESMEDIERDGCGRDGRPTSNGQT